MNERHSELPALATIDDRLRRAALQRSCSRSVSAMGVEAAVAQLPNRRGQIARLEMLRDILTRHGAFSDTHS